MSNDEISPGGRTPEQLEALESLYWSLASLRGKVPKRIWAQIDAVEDYIAGIIDPTISS